MSLEDRELEELLRSTVDPDSAPEVDFSTLLELKAGRLRGEAAAEARRALVADPELARAVLDVDRLEDLERAAGGVRPDRQEAAWERLVAAGLPTPAGEQVGKEAPQTPDSPAPVPVPARSTPWPLAFRRLVASYPLASMAASMVLASIVTILLLVQGSPDISGHRISGSQISGNLKYELLSLTADGGPTRQAGAQARTLVLSQRETAVVLGLNPPPRLNLTIDLPRVAEVVLVQGEVSSQPIAIQLQDEGIYLLWMPVDELISGPLRIELRDPAGHGIVAEYSVDVRLDASP